MNLADITTTLEVILILSLIVLFMRFWSIGMKKSLTKRDLSINYKQADNRIYSNSFIIHGIISIILVLVVVILEYFIS